MKFAKKFFVVLMAMALLVTCLAISSSATSDFTADNIEDVIEYHLYKTYMIETFDNYEVTVDDEDEGVMGGYEYADDDRVEIKDVFSFSESGKASMDYAVELNGESNKVLKVTNTTNNEIDYVARFDEATDKLVVSVRVKTNDFVTEENNTVNGSKFSIILQVNNPANQTDKTPTISMFSMDCRDTENMKFAYCKYSKSGADHVYTEGTEISNIAPELDKWYQIDAVFDFAEGEYSVAIESEDGATGGTGVQSLGTLESVNRVRLLINDVYGKTGTVTYLDNLFVYQGSFVRDVENKDAATSAAILNLDAMASAAETSLEDKVRIADVYGALFDDIGYTTTAPVEPNEDEEIPGVPGTPNKDKVDAVIASHVAYMNSTYAEALITYVDSLKTLTYYDKIKMAGQHYDGYDIPGYADRFDAMFCEGGQTEAEVAALAGLNADIAKEIVRVKALYDAEQDVIKNIEYDSNAFGSLLMGFDPDNKDYNYIKEQYEALSLFVKRDGTFKYALENGMAAEDVKFATIADAEPIYTALGTKKAEIEANAAKFMAVVDKMSAEPVLQQGFAALYAAYTESIPAYNGGVIHKSLDNSTYPGLSAVIALYNMRCAYVEERVARSNEFISIVNAANASTYYPTIIAQLAKAAPYLDADIANLSVEFDYAGVTEAKATYDALKAKVSTLVADSTAYLAAVNAIDKNAAYAALKTAVDAAVALKDKGAVLGIEGVTEANIKLAEAEAKVKSLEGNSATLIAAVEQLKSAKTLAERRELIYVANAAQAKAEASITGVAAAKTELASQITKFDADVAAANAALVAATEGACDVASFTAPTAGMYKTADVVKVMLK